MGFVILPSGKLQFTMLFLTTIFQVFWVKSCLKETLRYPGNTELSGNDPSGLYFLAAVYFTYHSKA